MADHTYKLSEIPLKKRFSHFWEYYKVPTLIILIFSIIVLALIKAMFFSPRPDINVIIANDSFVPLETWDKLYAAFEPNVSDYDDDGKVLIDINVNTVDKNTEMDIQQYAASNQKLIAVLSTGEYVIQVVDETMFNFLKSERLIGTYEDLSAFNTGKKATEDVKIPLSDIPSLNEVAKELTEEYFLTIRAKDSAQLGNSEKRAKQYENHLETFAKIVGFEKK